MSLGIPISTLLAYENTLKRRVQFWKGDFIEPISKWYGDRGVFGSGYDGSSCYNVIDYITISSLGNANDFGDLTVSRSWSGGGVSNRSRGCFGGGYDGSNNLSTIDYITISTLGNAQDFGDLTVARWQLSLGCISDGSRGVFGSGRGPFNVIDYITISILSNASDFGDLTIARHGVGAVSDGSRGCFGGGYDGASYVNVIDYITISLSGNASDFGDLVLNRAWLSGVSNDSRGCFGGGSQTGTSGINTMDYITISSLGNANDFGDLTVGALGSGSTQNVDIDRGVFGSRRDSAGNGSNVIDYINISVLGNASDFGDATVVRWGCSAVSGD